MATTHQVELPDEVYRIARRAAEQEGVTPEEWIAATVFRAGLPVPTTGGLASVAHTLSEALAGLIGVVDSRSEPVHQPRRTAVGDLIAEKFRKQGIGARHGNAD